MSLGHGASIVRNGLIACLDPANPKSYPGTGTIWYDISGNNNNASLVNGVTLSGNAFVFDGVDDYASIPIPQASTYSAVTIEGFIKWNAFNDGMFLGFTGYDVWTKSNCLGYNNGQSNVIGISAATVTSLGLLGNYKHYTFVMNRSGLLSANKIYINGVSQSLSPVVSTDGSVPGFATTLRLASWNNGGYYGNVTYGNVRVYNRELSENEIKQNYEALRGRYGV